MKKVLFIVALTTLLGGKLFAQVGLEVAEAKFVYNFTRFFDWPANEKTGDFVIGILGSPNLYKELVKITAGKKVVNQNIVITKFKNTEEVTKCHVIFVASNKVAKIGEIKANAGNNALVMSDGGNAISKGAVIRFFLSNDRLQYEFSKSNIGDAQLKYHSKVEELASKVY